MKIAVIIPGYNEEKYIRSVVQSVADLHISVIVVDDGSRDDTFREAHAVQADNVFVIKHEVNLGKGAAMLTGCEFAFSRLESDAVVFIDADSQHDPRELPLFFAELHRGAEVVFGVRVTDGDMPLVRFMGSKFASVALNLLFGRYIPDIPCGYKALSRTAFERVRWTSVGYEVETEIASRVALTNIPFAVVPIQTIYHDTDKGMTILDALDIFLHLLQWRISL